MKEEVAKILDPNTSLKNVKNQEQQERIKKLIKENIKIKENKNE